MRSRKDLACDKVILLAAIAWAIETDDVEFLEAFVDGSAETDGEWHEWRAFKSTLVMSDNVINQEL